MLGFVSSNKGYKFLALAYCMIHAFDDWGYVTIMVQGFAAHAHIKVSNRGSGQTN